MLFYRASAGCQPWSDSLCFYHFHILARWLSLKGEWSRICDWKTLKKCKASIDVFSVNNSRPKHTGSRCVCFSRKNFWKHRKEKNWTLIMDMILFSRGRKKSEKQNSIGRFGRERRTAMFLVPWTAFQKWQSEFAQVLGRASKEAAFPRPMWSFWGLWCGCGVAESGLGLVGGHHVGSWCFRYSHESDKHIFPFCCFRVPSHFQIHATNWEEYH